MKIFLKYINPFLAILVFMICFYASVADELITKEGSFNILRLFDGGIPSYFLAKGIFCSVSMFLLGKIVEMLIYSKQ